jgi:ribosomal protein L20A (L18A)
MKCSLPFSLSKEEKSLIELYTAISDSVNTGDIRWQIFKEESIAPKSVKVTGYMTIADKRSDTFSVVCEEEKPREALIAIANMKLLVMTCTSLGIPIDFEFEKPRKETEFKPVKSWKIVAEEHGIDPVEVIKCQDLRSLSRYCKPSKFPIAQALEATSQKFNSERVTVKQFFEFIWGEENYNRVRTLSSKKKKARTISVPQVEEVEEEVEVNAENRGHQDTKYVMGKLISAGINSINFEEKAIIMSERYGNFQYFCMNASDDEIASVLMLEQ